MWANEPQAHHCFPWQSGCILPPFWQILRQIGFMRYLMTLRWMFFMRVLMLDVGMLILLSFRIACSRMASPTPTMMVMRGITFPPQFLSVSIRGLYLVCFCSRACFGYLSLHYVISMNWSMWSGEGIIGIRLLFGALIMHSMYGLNFVRHWHGELAQVHLSIHDGVSCGGCMRLLVWRTGGLVVFGL